MSTARPWRGALWRTPNLDRTRSVVELDASTLSPEEFYRSYVAQCRPCVLRGAAASWPARELWRSKQHWLDVAKPGRIRMLREPYPQLNMVRDAIGAKRKALRAQADKSSMELEEFLDEVMSEGTTPIWSQPTVVEEPYMLGALLKDLGAYQFLGASKRALGYPTRLFAYRASLTDWHYHPADETLTTQVVGGKDFALLPPDEATWARMADLLDDEIYGYEVDLAKHPGFADVQPLYVHLDEGDAIYIPVFWWHLAEDTTDAFGVTLAYTFRTPAHVQGDLRYPALREYARSMSLRHAPIFVGWVAWSYAHRLLRLQG